MRWPSYVELGRLGVSQQVMHVHDPFENRSDSTRLVAHGINQRQASNRPRRTTAEASIATAQQHQYCRLGPMADSFHCSVLGIFDLYIHIRICYSQKGQNGSKTNRPGLRDSTHNRFEEWVKPKIALDIVGMPAALRNPRTLLYQTMRGRTATHSS